MNGDSGESVNSILLYQPTIAPTVLPTHSPVLAKYKPINMRSQIYATLEPHIDEGRGEKGKKKRVEEGESKRRVKRGKRKEISNHFLP